MAFKTFFERETLTGPNFNDWYRSLRIVLRVADTFDYLYKPCPGQPADTATEAEKAAFKAEYKKHSDVACIMLGKMSHALQRQFENYPPQNMLAELRKMFRTSPIEIYDPVDALHIADRPLHSSGKTVTEATRTGIMTFERVLKDKAPTPQEFTIQIVEITIQNRKANKKVKAEENPNKDQACHHCHVAGHWKRNCPLYIEELRANKKKSEPGAAVSAFYFRGVVSLSCLLDLGFHHTIASNGISVSLNDLLGLIHTDVCGPLRHVSRKGASYFLTFTDDFSRYGYVYLLKHKHEVFETFKVFKAEVELQLGKKIKALRSDRGGEYLSQEFKDYLSENGIVQNLTSPYTPQQNGVSERRNRTLLDMVRSMFNLTTLPLSFWDYALESAVRILNMVPTKKVDKTPYEIWHGKAPNLSYLKVWGCEAYVKRDSADKLQQRSVKCIFVGYPKETMGYYFYFPPENKVIVARYGDFLERDLISQEFSGRDYDLEDDHMDTLPSKNTSKIPVEPESLSPPSELIPVCRSERTKRAPNRLCLNMEVEDDVVGDLGEPANNKTAMLDPDKVIWQGAMDEEMNFMKVNEVWTEVDPPPNAKIVRSKWIFKNKTDIDGNVHTYKARLVAKGCTQTYRVDYEEMFSPVADIRAIRILIAIAAYYDYEI
ncbi:retrotransposon protein, putative, ty1-copia subclass [Tanacetum coccineum]